MLTQQIKSGLVLFAMLAISATNSIDAQKTKAITNTEKGPRLVVGIVVDQMRWDYLERFAPLFKANGGFNRMMNQGFSNDNCQIGYTPSVTACGHTGIYTGTVPAIHGITGNGWYDTQLKRNVYCSEDRTVDGVGAAGASDGKMSPKNMLTTSIADELRMANNFKSKVIGIALKDRGAILPAGHSANGAYWFDAKSGNFITSTYYYKELPNWVKQFNDRHIPDSLMKLGWNKSLTDAVYLQYATADEKNYEGKPFGANQTKMPYELTRTANEGFGKLSSTPWGNTLTVELAKAAVLAEDMGKDAVTDMLAVSFSSPDYVGHSFGPNSWEVVDNYIKLDEELGRMFDFLDATVGKGKYTAFLSADHAVAHVPGFMKENKLPGGLLDDKAAMNEMNAAIKAKFGIDKLVVSLTNYQVHFNRDLLDSLNADTKAINQFMVRYLMKKDYILNAFPTNEILTSPMPQYLREKIANGFLYNRSGDIQMVLKSGYIDGGATGTTHGLWYSYDAHIPLLWYGFGIKHGRSSKRVYMHDIASTLASLLKIQEPSGNIGNPIVEVLK
ncbi:alkaline phosphatase PafA [Sediminibacterium sp.]|uniref:alkaline phosphatase PafA n=1 Tax=Sediminibacterium sp. TaxID=1917865 RepID=UPI0027375D2E|nr:alkaline phosphatase PafA [Sediminibacterium sp.]MDP3393597.1 alkaline phosphatase family protein [Sediminibacterium sp.]MDP3566631.1 alkaline phosphatase family protein [Sediminibacterium sp.]